MSHAFAQIAGDDELINSSELAKFLGVSDPTLAGRLFAQFDHDGDGFVSLGEFVFTTERLTKANPSERVRFAFRLHDLDGSGQIDRSELARLFEASLAESKVEVSREQLAGLVEALFSECDTDGSCTISEDEFAAALDRRPEMRDTIAVAPVQWLRPCVETDGPAAQHCASRRVAMRHWLQNHLAQIVALFAWVLGNVLFFANAVAAYADSNVYVQIARGCGACLNFNGALILIPMMRNLLTWVRNTRVGSALPLDSANYFHRLVGNAMFVMAVVHTVAHLLNYSTLSAPISTSLLHTSAGLTGFILIILFAIMAVAAQNFVRRSFCFEWFYFTHLLYVGWFVLMLMHGPRFWMFALVPVVGFTIDRTMGRVRRRKESVIRAGNVLPAGVTELVIDRPEGFSYRPGEYVFAKVPSVARHEWHPFTISSAPESSDVITLHVRSAGNWTRKLHASYQSEAAGSEARAIVLDGPYGTPAVDVFDARVAVLIGGGIGVTPFASVLKSLVARKRAGMLPNLQKVWFYWLNRDQEAFSWFAELLSEIEDNNDDDFFEVRVFMTRLAARTDLKSAALHIAMDLHHKNTQCDLITGLKSRTHASRPDWSAELREIAAAHPGERPAVFLCGPPGLAHSVQKAAHRVGFTFKKERF